MTTVTRCALLRAGLLAGVALGAVGGGAAAQDAPPRDQEATAERIVDRGYLFELERPGPDWRILGEVEARRMLADAVAAAFETEAGLYAAVIVESAPGATAADMARIFVKNTEDSLEESQLDEFRPAGLAGRDAVRYVLTGSVEGQRFRYVNTVVAYRDHVYQLLGWGPASAVPLDGSCFEPLCEAFALRDGDRVRPRALGSDRADAAGVGWRLEGGAFRSAAFGLAVDPGDGWRVSVGDDLAQMNEEAEVGLVRVDPEVYLVLIPERIVDVDRAGYAEFVRERFTAALGVPSAREVEVEVAGEPVTLTLRTIHEGAALDYAHGVFFRGEHAFQVYVWWLTANREAAFPHVAPAFERIRFLAPAEAAALTAELARRGDPQDVVGPDYVLRGGVYRDFGLDFRWRKPTGAFWRVDVGADARLVDPSARLVVHSPDLGVSGYVLADRAPGFDVETLHQATLAEMLPPGHPARSEPARRRDLGDVEAHTSWIEASADGVEVLYLVGTAVQGDRIYQVVLWSMPEIMRAAREDVLAVVDGLEVPPGDLEASARDGRVVRDRRLGFALRAPGADWSLIDDTPPELSSVGRVLQWTDGPHAVTVVALCALSDTQDMAWFESTMEDLMVERLARELELTFGRRVDTDVAGRHGTRRTGRPAEPPGQVDVIVTQRGRTFFGLLVADEDGQGPDVDAVLADLEWLD